jgi:hypothetical protein
MVTGPPTRIKLSGTLGGIRTHTEQDLNLLTLPIGLLEHKKVATLGMTYVDRHSSDLTAHAAIWCLLMELNHRPPRYQHDALITELKRQYVIGSRLGDRTLPFQAICPISRVYKSPPHASATYHKLFGGVDGIRTREKHLARSLLQLSDILEMRASLVRPASSTM